ncbi:MAG: hypothetical protein ACE5GS_17585 [Kiloniellaceae bacterium]
MSLKRLTIERLRRERPDLAAALAAGAPRDLLVEIRTGPRKGERVFMTPAGAAKFSKRVRVLPAEFQPAPGGRAQIVPIKTAGETSAARRGRS